jgi:hypothetical protein
MRNTNHTDQLHLALREARDAAFDVHGALLEATRREYERDFGRVPDAATLLKVVTSEPAFAWLRPLTAAIADADELLTSPRQVPEGHARVLLAAIRDLLRADVEGTQYQRRYCAVIQASPEVAVVHGTAQRALRSVAIAWT